MKPMFKFDPINSTLLLSDLKSNENFSNAKKEVESLLQEPLDGKIISAFAVSDTGRLVGLYYSCTTPGCSCIGSWWDNDNRGSATFVFDIIPL